jgi:phosphoribosylaminoimidazole-succinocarboxamide synthase
LIVSTDRISAFDHIFPNGIPGKGIILNKISNIWFNSIKFVKNHLVETDCTKFPKPFCNFPELLQDRSVIVKKTQRIDYECIARGYIIGTGWKDYQKTGAICGIQLPEGLKMAQQFDKPIFTPATKADSGHDENISKDEIVKDLGQDIADKLEELTIKVYEFGRDKMNNLDIILADTKFEFGLLDGELILIDEILTPDSSRFWNKSEYQIGSSPVSFDKQYIRDYLETTDWDKNSSAPELPEYVVTKTKEKYSEILSRIQTIV